MTLGYILSLLLIAETSRAVDWVQPSTNTDEPKWGIRGGLMWALPPGGFRDSGGPRGLIRVAYPILTNGGYDLINFIAIEPVVKGRKGFSELEHSQRDNRRGKQLAALWEKDANDGKLVSSRLARLPNGFEIMEVGVQVEPFENGASVQLVISQRSDLPDEIKLAIHAMPGSAPMDFCVLTATMGNLARTRQLWLHDRVINSLKLHPTYRSDGFAPHSTHELQRLARNAAGDVIVAITSDEEDPASVFPFPGSRRWHYGGFKVTQYWRKPRGMFRDDLCAVVNARFTYWQSQRPIPGGVAFENFEFRERFYEGQEFVFGITRKTPAQLGISVKP